MKRGVIIIFLSVFILSINLVLAANYNSTFNKIYECGNITEAGNYTMNKSLSGANVTVGMTDNSPICLYLTSSNVVLDCNNSYIRNTTFVGYGIYAKGTSGTPLENVTIKNCNITLDSTNGLGLRLTRTSYSIIDNNTFNNNNIGIEIYLYSSYNNLSGNTINSATTDSVYINNYAKNNSIKNLTSLNNAAVSIWISDTAHYNKIFTSNLQSGGTSAAIYLNGIQGTEVYDTYLNSSSSGKEISVTAGANVNVINCTYNISKEDVSSSDLYRKWYLTINITNSSGEVENATNITVYNSTNDLINSDLTNSTGLLLTYIVEYYNNGVNRNYYSNYTINATKSGYYTNTTSHNATTNSLISLILNLIPPTPINNQQTSGGGGGSAGSIFWIITYPSITETQFKEGYSKELINRSRIGFNINNETHHLGIMNIDNLNQKVTMNVSSSSQIKTINLNEEWKVDVNSDGISDLIIKITNITSTKAVVFFKSIKEEVMHEVKNSPSEEIKNQEKITKNNKTNYPIIIIIILALIIILGLFLLFKNKTKTKYNRILKK